MSELIEFLLNLFLLTSFKRGVHVFDTNWADNFGTCSQSIGSHDCSKFDVVSAIDHNQLSILVPLSNVTVTEWIDEGLANSIFNVSVAGVESFVSFRIEFLDEVLNDNISMCNMTTFDNSCFWQSDEYSVPVLLSSPGYIRIPRYTLYIRIVYNVKFVGITASVDFLTPILLIGNVLESSPSSPTFDNIVQNSLYRLDITWDLPKVHGNLTNAYTSLKVIRDDGFSRMEICEGPTLSCCVDKNPLLNFGLIQYIIIASNIIGNNIITVDWETWRAPSTPDDIVAVVEYPTTITVYFTKTYSRPPIRSYELFNGQSRVFLNVEKHLHGSPYKVSMNSSIVRPNSTLDVSVIISSEAGNISAVINVQTGSIVVFPPTISIVDSYAVLVKASVPKEEPFEKAVVYARKKSNNNTSKVEITDTSGSFVLSYLQGLDSDSEYFFHVEWIRHDKILISGTTYEVLPPKITTYGASGPNSLAVELPHFTDIIETYTVILNNSSTNAELKKEIVTKRDGAISTFKGLEAGKEYIASIVTTNVYSVISVPLELKISTDPLATVSIVAKSSNTSTDLTIFIGPAQLHSRNRIDKVNLLISYINGSLIKTASMESLPVIKYHASDLNLNADLVLIVTVSVDYQDIALGFTHVQLYNDHEGEKNIIKELGINPFDDNPVKKEVVLSNIMVIGICSCVGFLVLLFMIYHFVRKWRNKESRERIEGLESMQHLQ